MKEFFIDGASDQKVAPFVRLELDDQQRAALQDYEQDVADPERLSNAVELLATQDMYQRSLQATLDRLPPGTAMNTAVQLLVANDSVHQAIFSSYDSESKSSTVQLYLSMSERLAAQAIVEQPLLRDLPNEQIASTAVEIIRTMRQDGSPSYYIDATRQCLAYIVDLNNFQERLKRTPMQEHKEARRVRQLSDDTDGLFDAIELLRTYRVKSVYIGDESALPTRDWHVYDWLGELHSYSEQSDEFNNPIVSVRNPSLARFDGFTSQLLNRPFKQFERGFAQPDNSESIGGVAMSYKGLIEGRPSIETPDISFDLYSDGHLYAHDGTPLRWFSEELGLSTQYEFFRARAVGMYTDMVLPSYVIDEDEDVQDVERKLKQSSIRARAGNFREMVLSRIRVIHKNPDIIDEALRMHQTQRRKPAKHSVIGFVKPIPKHHRASQRQREMCRKYMNGRELAEFGETYVHDHDRGGNEEDVTVRGHRAHMRYVGGALVEKAIETPDPNS